MLARKLSQKPHIGANFLPPQKSAVERAAERWFNREKSPSTTMVASDKVFPGQYFDSETNLHYNHFRYYDPQLGRYITSDPVGLRGGLSTYLYTMANPTGSVDPLGLVKTYIIIVGSLTGGAGISGEAGVIRLIDPCTLDYFDFAYGSLGGGLGAGGAATVEIGTLDIFSDNPSDFGGPGAGVSGFAAAGLGIAGSVFAPAPGSDSDYFGVTFGIAGGAGASASGMGGVTIPEGQGNLDLPSAIKDLIFKITGLLPECKDTCGE